LPSKDGTCELDSSKDGMMAKEWKAAGMTVLTAPEESMELFARRTCSAPRVGGFSWSDADPRVIKSRAPVILTTERSRLGASVILADCITTIETEFHAALRSSLAAIHAEADAAWAASAVAGFRAAWQRTGGLPANDADPDVLAVAAAWNDVATVGRLLGARDVNAVVFEREDVPGSLLRRPLKHSLLDVAVGSASVDLTKCLLEFHAAKPTRETLKMALAAGNLELIRLVRRQLREAELEHRVDLLEVAAEFHQLEALVWLVRDASIVELELLAVFALEQKLADMLVVAFDNGFRPWWGQTRELAVEWRASARFVFVPAPVGFLTEGGWWRDTLEVDLPLPRIGDGTGGEWTLPASIARQLIINVFLPPRVTTISERCFFGCSDLVQVGISSSVVAIGHSAFFACFNLTRVGIPASVRRIGKFAFCGCSALTQITIPSGVSAIGTGVFQRCSGLRSIAIPPRVTIIGRSAFEGCSALTQVQMPSAVTTIGHSSFKGCSSLTLMVIPSRVTTIGLCAFEGCCSLERVAIPSALMIVGSSAFRGCSGLIDMVIPSDFASLGSCDFMCVTKLERLTLVGSWLSPAIVAGLEGCLTSTAKVIGTALAGRKFGRFKIVA
jgi:hypothetical protein